MSENKTRVWQWTDIAFDQEDKTLNDNRTIIALRKPMKIVTFSRAKDGTVAAAFQYVDPNMAYQYVVRGNAPFYAEQCASMENAAKDTYKGVLVEITNEPDMKIGIIPKKYRPQPVKSVNEVLLEDEVAKLRAELEETKKGKEKK